MTWMPWAVRRPGPPQKVGYGSLRSSAKEGVVAHSMEGHLAAALAELDRPDRAASWHFSIATDGTIYQHYSTDDICWASGSLEANRRFVAVEHEGRAGQPLTGPQVEALAKVIAWCAQRYGWPRLERGITLWEHREMVRFGAAPTACPSGRIPWDAVLAKLKGEEEVVRMAELDRKPFGFGGPLKAYVLHNWQWQEIEVPSYHAAVVGLFEGWLRPKWLHELLQNMGTGLSNPHRHEARVVLE